VFHEVFLVSIEHLIQHLPQGDTRLAAGVRRFFSALLVVDIAGSWWPKAVGRVKEDVPECEHGGFMKRSLLIGLALATALAAAPAAKADTFYFSLSGSAITNPADPNCCAPSISGGGYLSGTAIGGGAYDITGTALSGVTFTIDGVSYTATLIADAFSPTPTYYPSGSDSHNYDFQYNDVLSPGASPAVDEYGLLFEITGTGAYNGAVIEIYTANSTDPNVSGTTYWWDLYLAGASTTNSVPTGWPIGDNNGGYGDPLDYFYVPEPYTFLLLGTGLFGLAAFLYRRRQIEQHWTA
jgi:hypothetical protein